MNPSQLPGWHTAFTAVVDADHHTVHAHGKLDLFNVELLRGAVENLRSTGHEQIVVDLAAVTFLDASAARELTRLQQALASEHGHLEIKNMATSPDVPDVGPGTTAAGVQSTPRTETGPLLPRPLPADQ
ncbi:MAG: STAS domain-containing protein [Allobranchiibius sp.]